MNERTITEKVMTDLKVLEHRGAVCIKHNDVGTKGIPDIQVAWLDHTSWAELKHLKPGQTLREICKAQQTLLTHQLATVNNGRGWVIVFEELPRAIPRSPKVLRTTAWVPRALYAHLWPQVVQPNEKGPWKVLGCAPVELTADDLEDGVNLFSTLQLHGAFRVPGWPYHIVRKLVTHALAP